MTGDHRPTMSKSIHISIPEIALVVLIGASGSGKSTFAKTHFKPTEVLSSDFFRGLISDDETDQTVTKEAFEALHDIAAKRLANYKLTVIDATSVQESARKPLVALAKQQHVFPIAIVLDMPEALCRQRNKYRPDRNFGGHVIGHQCHQLRRSFKRLKREGFRRIYTLRSEDEVQRVCVTREKVWSNRKDECGPFDIIGDVHGCYDELIALLDKLGYDIRPDQIVPPPGRKAIFLGDLVDRGPKIPHVLDLVMSMVKGNTALCIPGNHDARLVRALRGKRVRPTYGLSESLAQIDARDRKRYADFLDGLVSHYVLDDGNLVVAHAGMTEEMAGRTSGAVRAFALYGETTGETDEFGLPIRLNWAAGYRGAATVVYGHTPVPRAEWLNDTINLDTGCVFGGALTALRYPEKKMRFRAIGQNVCQTRAAPHSRNPSVGATNARRHARHRRCDWQTRRGYLPHPAHHHPRRTRHSGLGGDEPLCPRSQMADLPAADHVPVKNEFAPRGFGTPGRSVHILPRKRSRASDLRGKAHGIPRRGHPLQKRRCCPRTLWPFRTGIGRVLYAHRARLFRRFRPRDRFFCRLQNAVSKADLWNALDTDWIALDCELMPWSARAQQLLQEQYAAVGAVARASLNATLDALNAAAANGIDVADSLAEYGARSRRVDRYIEAYRAYCWPVRGLDDLKLAPFHILATEGAVHRDRAHTWHMETLAKLCLADPDLLHATPYRVVDLNDAQSCHNATTWWEQITSQGREGMVVKPIHFIARNKKGRLIQPAIKCRGREYLRIIYGPEYTTSQNLAKLRQRNVKTKQSLALREFALGLEALNRFVQNEPLRRIHECVFGVLALESEPVDPRL